MGANIKSKVYNYISIEEDDNYIVISSSLPSIEEQRSFLQKLLQELDTPDIHKQYIHCYTPERLLKS